MDSIDRILTLFKEEPTTRPDEVPLVLFGVIDPPVVTRLLIGHWSLWLDERHSGIWQCEQVLPSKPDLWNGYAGNEMEIQMIEAPDRFHAMLSLMELVVAESEVDE